MLQCSRAGIHVSNHFLRQSNGIKQALRVTIVALPLLCALSWTSKSNSLTSHRPPIH
jgi:hypothetical protein